MIREKPYQPIEPVEENDRLSAGKANTWVAGINRANQSTQKPIDFGLRWAITCLNADGEYPNADDDPVLFPFRFLSLESRGSARLPPIDPQLPVDYGYFHSLVIDPPDPLPPPDGFAFYRSQLYTGNRVGFCVKGPGVDFLPPFEIVMVGFSQSHYWIVRQNPLPMVVHSMEDGPVGQTFLCEPQRAVLSGDAKWSDDALYLSGTAIEWEPAAAKSMGPDGLLADTTATIRVLNIWSSDIDEGRRLVITKESSGFWVPISGDCA